LEERCREQNVEDKLVISTQLLRDLLSSRYASMRAEKQTALNDTSSAICGKLTERATVALKHGGAQGCDIIIISLTFSAVE